MGGRSFLYSRDSTTRTYATLLDRAQSLRPADTTSTSCSLPAATRRPQRPGAGHRRPVDAVAPRHRRVHARALAGMGLRRRQQDPQGGVPGRQGKMGKRCGLVGRPLVRCLPQRPGTGKPHRVAPPATSCNSSRMCDSGGVAVSAIASYSTVYKKVEKV